MYWLLSHICFKVMILRMCVSVYCSYSYSSAMFVPLSTLLTPHRNLLINAYLAKLDTDLLNTDG